MKATLVALVFLAALIPARAVTVTRESSCSVQNIAPPEIIENVAGPDDCSLEAGGQPGSLSEVQAAASTVAGDFSVTANISAIALSATPGSTFASASASIEEDYLLSTPGATRPGILQIFLSTEGEKSFNGAAGESIQIPGVFLDGCVTSGGLCTLDVTLGQQTDYSIILTAFTYASASDSSETGSASASADIEFFEADGRTPVPFTIEAPEPATWILGLAGLVALRRRKLLSTPTALMPGAQPA